MDEETFEIIKRYADQMELDMNESLAEILDQYDPQIAVNILINVGTSMLAKALVMVDPEVRDALQMLLTNAVEAKVNEGSAAIESMVAIGRAMGHTCQPLRRKKD